ncbi:hypothetical protein [Riemerella columbipharyngis]|uniref:Uncharacterized protein n=1 Tax=Riemerella columbipharyngis TaxID=1071918 RepID=A0A1G7B2Y0_9FLAO|nr:hypothetical protein [Riemerella columbipharyngis]SDE21468.1 hypothetical protein SAMN05421544_10510 [Riemerella columbipharyngis]
MKKNIKQQLLSKSLVLVILLLLGSFVRLNAQGNAFHEFSIDNHSGIRMAENENKDGGDDEDTTPGDIIPGTLPESGEGVGIHEGIPSGDIDMYTFYLLVFAGLLVVGVNAKYYRRKEI